MARRSSPGLDSAARLGRARFVKTRLGGARLGGARFGGARFGGARFGGARFGKARFGKARLSGARRGKTRLGGARLGRARLGSAGFDGTEGRRGSHSVWLGVAWCGSAARDTDPSTREIPRSAGSARSGVRGRLGLGRSDDGWSGPGGAKVHSGQADRLGRPTGWADRQAGRVGRRGGRLSSCGLGLRGLASGRSVAGRRHVVREGGVARWAADGSGRGVVGWRRGDGGGWGVGVVGRAPHFFNRRLAVKITAF
ncbi:pentapeptide repeat-containing protein [Saccharothrix saharensis]|uniref:pentapeptide repeat-containing protein n=1 Tax=Saccharothrix saharensis TaxID=571190 RepID=UPI0036C0D580